MDIIAKLNELRRDYEATEQQIAQLQDALTRIEGGFIVLMEMGKELGVLDEFGNPIPTENPEGEDSEIGRDEECL